MAAPSGIVWGGEANGKGRIGIYTSLTNTETTSSLYIEIWIWSKYSVDDSRNDVYYDDNSTSATTWRKEQRVYHTSNSSWSTSNQTRMIYGETATIQRGKGDVTRYISAKMTGVEAIGATMYVTASYVVPSLKSYNITYNANGGSGAPSAQTKWYGIEATLSDATPTRTGYSFLGWSTSSTATSAAYASGAKYTSNAELTLYAVWKADTYAVTYNANGGSGAPSAQTKTHDVTLKLSTTKPTKTNYNFLGWGTSATSTSVSYAAGANYTANSAITLYAIWELAYTPPRINDLIVERAVKNSDGTYTPNEDGTWLRISYSWIADEMTSTHTYKWKTSPTSSWSSLTYSAASSIGSRDICPTEISVDAVYDVTITIADSKGSSTLNRVVSGILYHIDFKPGIPVGVAIGKPAESDNLFDVNIPSRFREDVTLNGDADIDGSATIDGGVTAKSTLSVTGATTLNNTLKVGSTANFSSYMHDQYGRLIPNNVGYWRDGVNLDENTESTILASNTETTPYNGDWYVETYCQSTPSATSGRLQVAHPYYMSITDPRQGAYYRYNAWGGSTAWTRWIRYGANIYSTSEVNTGDIWIDGKPIYRKVIEVGAKTSNDMIISTGVSNMETQIDIYGMLFGESNYGAGYVFKIPCYTLNADYSIQLEFTGRTHFAIGTYNRTWSSGFVIIEYTKTTD